MYFDRNISVAPFILPLVHRLCRVGNDSIAYGNPRSLWGRIISMFKTILIIVLALNAYEASAKGRADDGSTVVGDYNGETIGKDGQPLYMKIGFSQKGTGELDVGRLSMANPNAYFEFNEIILNAAVHQLTLKGAKTARGNSFVANSLTIECKVALPNLLCSGLKKPGGEKLWDIKFTRIL